MLAVLWCRVALFEIIAHDQTFATLQLPFERIQIMTKFVYLSHQWGSLCQLLCFSGKLFSVFKKQLGIITHKTGSVHLSVDISDNKPKNKDATWPKFVRKDKNLNEQKPRRVKYQQLHRRISQVMKVAKFGMPLKIEELLMREKHSALQQTTFGPMLKVVDRVHNVLRA